MGRSMRRAAVCALLGSVAIAVSGCAAGQIAETAQEVPAVPGNHADLGPIGLRNVQIAYPADGVYKLGSTALLQFSITNSSDTPDRLIGVHSPSATRSAIEPAGATSTSATGPNAKPADKPIDITIPANGSEHLDGDKGIALIGMTRQLRSSQQSTITFQFAHAGQIMVPVPVGPAATYAPPTGASTATSVSQ